MNKALADIPALILAGGLGTRLQSVVPGKPKALAEVSGRPFVYFLLDHLIEQGFRTIVLCTGFLAGQVRDSLGVSYRGAVLHYSEEHSPMGTAGALRLAADWIGAEGAAVLNGDSFCDVNLAELRERHSGKKAAATLALSWQQDTTRFGRVELDEEARIVRFREKDSAGEPGWINAGVYWMNKSFVSSIPEGRKISLEQEVFPAWIGRGLYGAPTQSAVWDIGVPEAYALAQREFPALKAKQ